MNELPDHMMTPQQRAEKKAWLRHHTNAINKRARADAHALTRPAAAAPTRPEDEVGARVFPEQQLLKLTLSRKETRIWHDNRRARESLHAVLRDAMARNDCTRFEVWSGGGKMLYVEGVDRGVT